MSMRAKTTSTATQRRASARPIVSSTDDGPAGAQRLVQHGQGRIGFSDGEGGERPDQRAATLWEHLQAQASSAGFSIRPITPSR
jgi:hypothetical protein